MTEKKIVFDMIGVLAHWGMGEHFQELFGVEKGMEMMHRLFGDPVWKENVDYGSIPENVLFEEVVRRNPDLEQEYRQIQYRWHDFIEPREDTEALARRLKAAGYPLYYLSNFPREGFDAAFRRLPVFRLMEGGLVSADVHQIKPDPAIFQTFLKTFDLAAEDCIFADDLPANVEGARAVGMQGFVYTTAEAFAADLNSLGLTF